MKPDPRSFRAALLTGVVALTLTGLTHAQTTDDPRPPIRGMTISCQTYGPEWGTDGFGETVSDLKGLGVNAVAIHPYARIRGDGQVVSRLDPANPPIWITRPIQEAHARGVKILIKPHLAYWGSPFSWRGEIDFPDPEARARFFQTYTRWIVDLARITAQADAFAVGTELDKLIGHEAEWRALIAQVRKQTGAKLLYAANWTDYHKVPFQDALDYVGVQAYFPLMKQADPDATEADLRAGWMQVLKPLKAVWKRTGKPIVFTELGYDVFKGAAHEPWKSGGWRESSASAELQLRCYRVALEVLNRERRWLHGAFVWKWFVGAAPGEDFLASRKPIRDLLMRWWRR